MVKELLETEETIDMNELTVVPMSVEEADGVIECGDISVIHKGTVSKLDSYEDIYSYTVD